MPLLMAVCVAFGIVIGTFYANHFSGNRLNIINSGSNRLNNLLHIIDDQYVDNVNIDSLVDKAIPQILSDLDPHSVYITAKDMQAANDELKGSFSGVGIEFNIREDTLHVQNVIKNAPAERAGLLAGDKVVSIDGKPFVGKTVTNDEAMRRLKGPKDTKVRIGVLRYGHKKPLEFTVTRGDIPQKSITATYMLDDDTGYIRVKNFGERTYPDMLIALAKLSQEGCKNLVIDLRDNTGGFLQSAVQMANEFLPKNKLIVYTQGRKSQRQDYVSDGKGTITEIYDFLRLLFARASDAYSYTTGEKMVSYSDAQIQELITKDYSGKRIEEYLLSGFFFSSLDGRKEGKRRSRPLPRPGKLAGYGMNPKRDGANFAGGRSRPSLDKNLEGVAEG